METKPLNKLAQRLIAKLQEQANAEMQAILQDAAEIDGINPQEGWGFDPQSGQWARQVPPTE